MLPEIWGFDYILGFMYFIVIYFFAYAYKSNKMKTDRNFEYFMPALLAKLIGGVGFVLLSIYLWEGGDTFVYFETATGYVDLFLEDTLEAIKVTLLPSDKMNWYEYKFAYGHHKFLNSPASFTTVKITGILSMFSFKSYVATTILFSAFSFLGVWNMYYSFCKIYPHLRKQLLYAFFFIPSVILWGSGILKDTITIACVGWLVYAFMNLIIFKRKRSQSLILILLATFFIALLKPYILYILYPALFIWVQSNLKNIIKSNLLRVLIAPFIALTLIFSSVYLTQELSESAGKYQIEKLESTLEGFQNWHTTVSETKDQSGYTLGDMDYTPLGITKKIPAAFAVTFYRPYPWEIRNASTLLGAFEGIILLLFTLWLILKLRLRLFRYIYQNKDILFLMIFATIFGVVVGISSYNFGALSRYKMPAQMFYVVAMVLVVDKTGVLSQDVRLRSERT